MAVMIGLGTFVLFLGAFLLLRRLQQHLPEDHRSDDSTATVRIGITVVSTLSGLVLGLVLSSMKTNFDTVQRDVRRFGTELVLLDSMLRSCEDAGKAARVQLLDYAEAALQGTWPQDGAKIVVNDRAAATLLQKAERSIIIMTATDPVVKYYSGQARQVIGRLVNLRTVIISENKAFLPPVFLIMLVSWFTLLFGSFGFKAPSNLTVTSTMVCAAFAVASAIGLMTDLDSAFTGLVTVSDSPLRDAIATLSQP